MHKYRLLRKRPGAAGSQLKKVDLNLNVNVKLINK